MSKCSYLCYSTKVDNSPLSFLKNMYNTEKIRKGTVAVKVESNLLTSPTLKMSGFPLANYEDDQREISHDCGLPY